MCAIRGLIGVMLAGFLAACGGGGGGGGNTTPDIPPPTTSLSGTVTYNGAPMPGVTVVAFNTNSNSTYATATTDASGNYTFSGMGTSCTENCVVNYQFWPVKAGYAFYPVLANNPTGNRAAYLWNPQPYNWYVNTGAAVTRAGYNGQFTNPGGGAGIVFTVINFNSTPGNSVTGANFVAYDGSSPLVHLAASGQSTSYAAGDDAALHHGVAWPATRFVDNGDGTVTDKLTGLVWLKNASCLASATWAAAVAEATQLANGSCGLADGSVAGTWRLPNLWEMESIVDESASNPAVTAGSPFANIALGGYWTSTSYYGGEGGSPQAWVVRMSDGRYINDGAGNVKVSSSNAVWAVKGAGGGTVKLQQTGEYVPFAPNDDGTVEAGVPLTYPRMRDNGNGTVTDTMTGLVWMKQANCLNATWAGALQAVASLASGQCGLSDGSKAGDWRMPNRKEMESLSDRGINNHADYWDTLFTSANRSIPSQPPVFLSFIQFQYYWTSSTNASNTNEAWTVFSCDYGAYDIDKSNTGYTLAVRGG